MVETLSHYRLLNKLGTGGMGTVYRAQDIRTGQSVAVKVLHPHLAADGSYIRRFRREAQIARSLDSPHIVKVLDFGHDNDSHFLAMEYVEGKTLAEVINKEGRLPLERAVSIACQIAQALQEGYHKGIVHRDIKPQNVIITKDGLVKVTDFGIARVLGQTSMTASGAFLGTPLYVSPEHAMGKVDIRSDIYSLGVVLFQMLAGVVPFNADTPLAVLMMHRENEPPPLSSLRPDVPDWLHRLVHRCLEKRPERRFQTPRELAAALEVKESGPVAATEPKTVAVAPARGGDGGGAGTAAPPATRAEPQPWPTGPRPGGRRRGQWIAIAGAGFAGLAAVAIVIGLALAGAGDDGPSPVPSPTPTATPTVTGTVTATVTGTATPSGTATAPPGVEEICPLVVPGTYNGLIHLNGVPAPSGYAVIAKVGGMEWGSAVVSSGRYVVDIPGHLPSGPPCFEKGGALTFEINGATCTTTPPTDTWASGLHDVDLSCAAAATRTPPTPSPAPATPSPAPPLGGRIAFVSARDGNHELYVMNADGSDQSRLTNSPEDERWPAWSPDGSKIAFVLFRDGNDEIYVMNSDGSGQTNLTNHPAGYWEPTWSPDSSKIAFQSDRDGNYDVYVMNADGSDQTNLTNSPTQDGLPAWSPDGSKIAFVSSRDGNWEVYVMNADGSEPTRLTNNAAYDGYPAWSPDGSKIAFQSDRDGEHEVYVMNADGSDPVNLTNDPARDWVPAWSPDGSKIAFQSDRDGNYEVYVMNADGSDPVNLTNNPAWDGQPTWSP